jgi:hypothetical protein
MVVVAVEVEEAEVLVQGLVELVLNKMVMVDKMMVVY